MRQMKPGFARASSLRHERQIQLCAKHTALRPPVAEIGSHGILTMYPSPAALAIGLGPTNPWLIYIAKETLIFRRADISSALRLLVPTFLLPHAPEGVTASPSLQSGILSYHLKASLRICSFVGAEFSRLKVY